MSQITSELKAELQKGLAELQTLRDEIRVQLHLAGMDAKDAWSKLEPTITDVEKLAEEVSEASRTAVNEARTRLREFRESWLNK